MWLLGPHLVTHVLYSHQAWLVPGGPETHDGSLWAQQPGAVSGSSPKFLSATRHLWAGPPSSVLFRQDFTLSSSLAAPLSRAGGSELMAFGGDSICKWSAVSTHPVI